MLTCVDHLVVAVEDLAEARRNYVALLGRTPSWTGSHPEYGTENVLFRLDNTYLELLAPTAPGVVADELRRHLDARGEGPWALALGTDDAAAAAKWLRERGLSPSDPIPGLGRDEPSGAYRRFSNVLLPPEETAGVRILVIEHHSLPEELPPALPVADAGSVVSGCDHVVVMTPDAERAKRFYGETLGIRLALDRSFEQRGVRLLFFRLGGVTLEIGARLRREGEPVDGAAGRDTLWGLAWQVPEITAARARIAATHLDVSEVRDGHKPGTRVCSIRGAVNGVATLVIEPVSR